VAYVTRVTIDFDWVPDGGGTSFLGIDQADNPGYSANNAAGAVGMAQTARMNIREIVPGGDAPTLANFLTALTNAANDMAGTPIIGTVPQMSQPGAVNGDPRTPLAIIQSWATGLP
jgi:hypothetical protein